MIKQEEYQKITDTYKSDKAKTQLQLKKLELKIGDYKNRILEYEKNLGKLSEGYDLLSSQMIQHIEELKAEALAGHDEIIRYKNMIEKLSEENDQLSENNDLAKKEMGELKEHIEELEKKLLNVQNSLVWKIAKPFHKLI